VPWLGPPVRILFNGCDPSRLPALAESVPEDSLTLPMVCLLHVLLAESSCQAPVQWLAPIRCACRCYVCSSGPSPVPMVYLVCLP